MNAPAATLPRSTSTASSSACGGGVTLSSSRSFAATSSLDGASGRGSSRGAPPLSARGGTLGGALGGTLGGSTRSLLSAVLSTGPGGGGAAAGDASGGGGGGFAGGLARPRVRRPTTGAIHRHRAICALIMAHPGLVPDKFESLLVIDSGDAGLEALKKAVIDAVIRDPDLDAAALRHHLNGSNLADAIILLEGDEMKARMPFDPDKISGSDAGQHLNELLQLVEGSTGLFSSGASIPR